MVIFQIKMKRSLIVHGTAALWKITVGNFIVFFFNHPSSDSDHTDSYGMGVGCTQDLDFNSSFIIHPCSAQASQKISGNEISLAFWHARYLPAQVSQTDMQR